MQNNKTAYITISPGGRVELEVLHEKEDLLRSMQAAVDGYVETVPDMHGRLRHLLGADRPVMLCNDEGLLMDLPRNPMAQALTGIAPLCGPVAIVQAVHTPEGDRDLAAFPIAEALRLFRRLKQMAVSAEDDAHA